MSPAPGGDGGRRLVVLRHGETTHNAAGIWQGQLDSPLSDLGLEQADAVGPALASFSPDRIVTSDLTRARVTAESVGRATGIRVELDPRLREIHAGGWQGLSAAEVAERWPEERAAVLRGEDVRRGGDGESMQDVLTRVGEALEELLADLPAGACAVVSTHGAAARAVAAWVLDLELEVAWRVLGGLGNCHWGELREGRAGWRLQTWNASSGVASRTGSSPP
ncbi:MAG TPA: histidine phosphatase family protein [Ornithinibacter sp.]|nr:histidine phosphatase family protein [Ornithinibacter sp.]